MTRVIRETPTKIVLMFFVVVFIIDILDTNKENYDNKENKSRRTFHGAIA